MCHPVKVVMILSQSKWVALKVPLNPKGKAKMHNILFIYNLNCYELYLPTKYAGRRYAHFCIRTMCTVFVTFSVPNKYVSLRCPRNAYGPAGADTSGAANHK